MKVDVGHLSIAFKQESGYLEAINDLSFHINAGETFALLGESGCGKSLTASALMRLLPNSALSHERSQVLFEKNELLSLPESEMQKVRGKRISMIFQEPMTSLNPVLTIGYQIIEVLVQQGVKLRGDDLRQQAIALLEKVEIPEPARRIDDYPHQLSGGQKQRVMIAISLAAKPDLLIADEPTTALDVTIQAQVLNLLKSLTKEMNTALLLITHDLSVVKTMADRVGVMYAGQMVECCDLHTFFSNAKHPYSKRLLACIPTIGQKGQPLNPIEGRVPALSEMPHGCRFMARCQQAQSQCETMPTLDLSNAHQVRCHFPQSQPDVLIDSEAVVNPNGAQKQDIILKVSDLQVHFPIRKGLLKREVGCVKAVDGVSFELYKGQTLALVGESGCGKTTLSRTICQLLSKTSGAIELEQKPLLGRSKTLASKLQIVFQDPFSSMNPRMLIQDILLEGTYAAGKQLLSIEIDKKVRQLLDMVGLPSSAALKYPHEFSGGQRQRINIARALAVKPSILICDEPTSALDVSVQAQILNLLLSLQEELGLSYLFISHDLAVVSYMADDIMVMQQGKIVEYGPALKIIKNPQKSYTKTLLSASNL